MQADSRQQHQRVGDGGGPAGGGYVMLSMSRLRVAVAPVRVAVAPLGVVPQVAVETAV